MSWWCHWQRQCKAGAYRKNGCDDTLLLTLCCGFLGLFFNCSVLYPRPPWPISCTMCSWWCFRADNIGAETLLHSLNSGGLLEENCSASLISALSFLSSFLGCKVFFVVGFKPRTSTHSCQVWHPYWPAGSRWVSSLGWISVPCKSFRLQTSAWPLLIIWFCLIYLFVTASAMLSLLVAPNFRLAQLLEPCRASSAEQCPYTLWSCFCFSIVTSPRLLIPLPLLPAPVELGGIVPQHGNVQLSMQGAAWGGEYYHESTGMKKGVFLHGGGVCISFYCHK